MKTHPAKTVIVITGPTASGKTAAAIRLAKHFKTEIISADSRQCYREMNIGVARPSPEELAAVPHHFIASHSIREEVTAALFEEWALQKVKQLFEKYEVLIMVGGTGLYIRAFCEGLDAIPGTDPAIRQQVISGYEEKGMAWLREEIKQKDPLFYEKGETRNPQRMMRALEVVLSTGQSIFSFHKKEKMQRDFSIIKTGLDLSREELHRNIHTRVDKMMEQGLPEEARSLLPYRDLNALQTVGYSEMFAYLDGTLSLEKAVEEIKTHTRQYARRQLTWFRKDKEIQWFSPLAYDEMRSWIECHLQ
ncbi:MAG: tRNA (adenosine(37)-N6)-dimethylallyltransferase MiaA [Sphingobacteriales bacterium]|nr:tRNA (adenosine(37)-N6)-dimethylallyltransferase MiaA [Sphingobacteriales bacterium]